MSREDLTIITLGKQVWKGWEGLWGQRIIKPDQGRNFDMLLITNDGLVKSSIYVVVDLKRRLAVPHVLPIHRFRYYA